MKPCFAKSGPRECILIDTLWAHRHERDSMAERLGDAEAALEGERRARVAFETRARGDVATQWQAIRDEARERQVASKTALERLAAEVHARLAVRCCTPSANQKPRFLPVHALLAVHSCTPTANSPLQNMTQMFGPVFSR